MADEKIVYIAFAIEDEAVALATVHARQGYKHSAGSRVIPPNWSPAGRTRLAERPLRAVSGPTASRSNNARYPALSCPSSYTRFPPKAAVAAQAI